MSTDDQKYSILNQQAAIRRYAEVEGLDIVRTYTDAGKSGLRLQGRTGLQDLLKDIATGEPPFETLLVYDVSRLGRFQDTDEAAHYEYLCKLAGVKIHYCAEPFPNDGTPLSAVLKSLKRAMAAEYSRELSTKVFAGQARLIELGYRQGGRPGVGFRRLLIDQLGRPKGLLEQGEQKSIQSDRVVLVLGPPHEVALIRTIFHSFVVKKMGEQAIVNALNRAGEVTDRGRPWQAGTVTCILTNEKYIGTNVFGRTTGKLHGRRTKNPTADHISKKRAFEPIVEEAIFWRAQEIIKRRLVRSDPVKMLAALKALYKCHNTLSTALINRQPDMEAAATYVSRFGSLRQAYALVGFEPKRDFKFVGENRVRRTTLAMLSNDIVAGFVSVGADVNVLGANSLLINGGIRLILTVLRPRTFHGATRWVTQAVSHAWDLHLIARLSPKPGVERDFFLLPRDVFGSSALRLEPTNARLMEAFRLDCLTPLFELGRQHPVRP